MAEEFSQPGELSEGLSSMSPQPGKILEFNNLPLDVIADVIVMVVGDIPLIQVV